MLIVTIIVLRGISGEKSTNIVIVIFVKTKPNEKRSLNEQEKRVFTSVHGDCLIYTFVLRDFMRID